MSAPDLLSKLLSYVVEQSREIDPHSFKLTGHKGFFRQKNALAGLPGVQFDLKVEGDHTWLRVERLEATDPPPVQPQASRALIAVSSNPAGAEPSVNEPALAHRLASNAADKSAAQLQQDALLARGCIDPLLAEYLPLWRAWAHAERARRQSIGLYGDLFALKYQLEADETGKPQELVWGLGVAAWKLEFQQSEKKTSIAHFQYPLITQAMEISVEPHTLALLVRPRGVDARLEFDAFSRCQLKAAAETERMARQALAASADALPVTPFDAAGFEPVLKLVAGNLHERGRYLNGQDMLPVAGDDLAVTDAWVLLSRPRSDNFLHEDIERLKQRIDESGPIPAGSLALVTPPSDERPDHSPVSFRGLSGGPLPSSGARGAMGKARELFFPLPYNHEQVTIVEQLERADGVAVQGPPGTGKTHTIANIVCHYLATGRKVLVTSKGEQALEVLQSKIPESVRPLTVALLSGDREGMRQFQTSIEAIIHNVSQLNPEVVRTEIEALLSAIDRAHSELAAIDRRVDEIALSQLAGIEVDGVPLRAQKMAELVVAGRARHGWFDDELTLAPEHAPPLTAAEAQDARACRRRLGADLAHADARLPASAALPASADIGALHGVLLDIAAIEAAEASGALPALRAGTPQVLQDARRLLMAVEAAAQLAQELEDTGEIWTAETRRKCRLPDFASERQALEALFAEIDALALARAGFLQRPVEVPEAAAGSAAFDKAVARAAQTGKPFGLFALGAAEAKEQISCVRIAGLPPQSDADWQHVLRHLQLSQRVHSFGVRWNQFADVLSIPAVRLGAQGAQSAHGLGAWSAHDLREIERVAALARKAHQLATRHDAQLPALAERVFAKVPQALAAQLRGLAVDLREVREHLRRHLARAELTEAAALHTTLQERLAGATGPASNALQQFALHTLGDTGQSIEKIVARYADCIAELRRIDALAPDFALLGAVADRIGKAGAGRWAARLLARPVPASGEDETLPMAWRDAWKWARIKTHLESIEARAELIALAERRRNVEAGLARSYEAMVSRSAWRATKLGASAKVLSALETYRTAIRRIGQGTGPNATRHRRDAQKAMHDAQGAVPCWVMSHSKVSETLPATLGSFDLVIVDEASQSDLWALPAVLRGKKILVVGDDRQVSPDGGFISAARIQELKGRFLADQPYAAILTPEKSLYDIASTVFAAQKVMLREHFRCVPAIIAYSNRFYNDFMQPLRIPKASERIDPPLVDIFVPGGYRDKNDINRPEAQAILAEVQAILGNPQLAGRSIGVVSLLGPDQAKHIDTLVRSHCDAAELIARNFKCGDARVFQGSERDIMFLSLVADAKNSMALSGNRFEQRFNVAASRARDRMYLVRSVEMKDLSQADLRAGLLAHFTQPLGVAGDQSENRLSLCESGFEREVYTALHGNGYRVVPQVRAGAFRIDMVVEGADDTRLAIECDGDEFHGPDRWAADMNRQRVLERAGWTFWRCFASTWALRREEVLGELLQRLAAMGIEPIGALNAAQSLVESRVWLAPVDEMPADAAGVPDQPGNVLEEAIADAAAANHPHA